jgi:Family of unknown function (DUF6279)
MFIKNRYISIVYRWILSVENLNTGVKRLWLPLIISCLLATGCSSVLLGYDAVQPIVKYQLNKYFDLSTSQQELADRRLDEIFDWHRKTQLIEYSRFLTKVTAKVDSKGDIKSDSVSASLNVLASDVESWRLEFTKAWLPIADKVSGPFTELVLTLEPKQINRMKRKLKDANDEMREDYVKVSASSPTQAREKARYERIVKRSETFLDDLTPDQLAVVARRAKDSPDAEEAWFAERVRRQLNLFALIEKINGLSGGSKLELSQAEPLMRDYLRTVWLPKDAAHKLTINASAKASDETSAQVLSRATVAQRTYMVKKFKGYARDFERLSKR